MLLTELPVKLLCMGSRSRFYARCPALYFVAMTIWSRTPALLHPLAYQLLRRLGLVDVGRVDEVAASVEEGVEEGVWGFVFAKDFFPGWDGLVGKCEVEVYETVYQDVPMLMPPRARGETLTPAVGERMRW